MVQKNKTYRAIMAYGMWVIKWRWPIIIGSFLVTIAAGYGTQGLNFATNYRVFFSKENPQLKAFEKLQNVYTKVDNVVFVIEPKNGDVFTPSVLTAVEDITQEGWKIPFSSRVDSVTNFQHTRAEEDDLLVGDLVEGAQAKPVAELEEARNVAIQEPTLRNIAINGDASLTAVNITFQLPQKEITEIPQVAAYVRDLEQKMIKKYPDLDFHVTGMVMLNNAFSEAAQGDLQKLVPIMYLGMIILMLILLRSVSGTIATLLVIAFSTITAMGLAGWINTPLTPPSVNATTMILTLAVADSIHILISMLGSMRKGLKKNEAIMESLRINMSPVFMTSLTTVIGFLSMNFSDAPPFRHLGNITAVGMTAAFFFSVMLLPALMSVLPLKVKHTKSRVDHGFDWLSDFVVRNRRPLLWVSSFVVIFIGFFITKNELNDQFVEYFDKRIPFRADTDYVMENLTGIYTIEHSIGAGESSGISNPDYLKKLEEFTQWYRTQPGVLQVNSFSHVMKRLNKSMHGDDESYFKLPEKKDLAAQYLLLYEFSLPFGLDLNNQLNVDKSATRVTATLANITTNEIKATGLRAEQWLKDNAPEYMFSHGVSPSIMFTYITERNIKGMLLGTTLAMFLISLSLVLAFRSVKFGILSLIPNLIPAIMAFGLWGLLISEIGLAMSVVTGMTLGIVVDDTIHFISKYLRARREQELDPAGAVRSAFSVVGRALLVTSIILVGGFAILSMSYFKLNGAMGQLSAIVIALALIADFTLLPALLMKVEEKDINTENETVKEIEGGENDPAPVTAG